MKQFKWWLLFLLALLAACKSQEPVVDNQPKESTETVLVSPPPPVVEPKKEEEEFDPHSISQEVFDTTLVEVQQFIEKLNRIISGKNYSLWKAALSDEYFQEISSREFLTRTNESKGMKTRKIVLRTPEDYFKHVVVPSRANSRVDDIEFINTSRVKVITISSSGQRLRLYDLEKSGDVWTIIN